MTPFLSPPASFSLSPSTAVLERAAESGEPLDRLRLGDRYFTLKDYPSALDEYREVKKAFSPEARKREAWCLVEMGDYRGAAALLDEKKEQILALERLPLKSEATARCLSTVLPGLGQAYAGQWTSGLNAFALNLGFFGLLAYTASQRDPVGFLLTFGLGNRFYTGNLENATRFTRADNARALETKLQALRLEAMFKPL